LSPQDLAARFTQGKIFGIGSTVREFISNVKAGKTWERCGPNSAGNGALMRISPLVIPYLRTGGGGVMVDTALCAMITHNNSLSLSVCLLLNYLIWQLLDMNTNPDPEWWLSQIDHVKDLMTGSNYRPRGGECVGLEVSPWDFIQERIRAAVYENLTTFEACSKWWSGAYLLETIPCVLYILIRHGHDPEESITRAVNDTKDNDTIASIVGALVGALHGKDALPKKWIDGLTGRTRFDDDGKIFELIRMSKEKWWY
jgi:ADP-ribosylglycohydrolase